MQINEADAKLLEIVLSLNIKLAMMITNIDISIPVKKKSLTNEVFTQENTSTALVTFPGGGVYGILHSTSL